MPKEEQLNFPFAKPGDKPETDEEKKFDEIKPEIGESGEIKDQEFESAMEKAYDGLKNWRGPFYAQIASDYNINPLYFEKLKKFDNYARTILGRKSKILSEKHFAKFAGMCKQKIKECQEKKAAK